MQKSVKVLFRLNLVRKCFVSVSLPLSSWRYVHFIKYLISLKNVATSPKKPHQKMSGVTIEKTKYECAQLPKRFHREEVLRKTGLQVGKVDLYYSSRGMRNDASLVPPIRQTASIFKQPVTVYKTQEGKVKSDYKNGNQEKPKQLFWEKRLEGLRACDIDGVEFESMQLPKGLKPVGPHVTEETIIQSVATALHVSAGTVTGQTGTKTSLEKNPGVFLDPKQPLVQAVNISDDDIKRQEDRVAAVRAKLQEALRE